MPLVRFDKKLHCFSDFAFEIKLQNVFRLHTTFKFSVICQITL